MSEKYVGPNDPAFWRHSASVARGHDRAVVANPYADHAWVYSCAAAIAMNISQVHFGIFVPERDEPELEAAPDTVAKKKAICASVVKRMRMTRRKGEGLEEITEGDWVRLFRKPNPTMVGSQLWEAILIYLTLTGECYIVKEGMPGKSYVKGTVPAELWVYGPHGWKVETDGHTKNPIGYSQTKPGESTPTHYELHEVIHLTRFDPGNQLGGQGNLRAVLGDVRADVKASVWNEDFFDQGAEPGGVLTTDEMLTPEAVAEIKTAWEDKHAGIDKAHRIAILHTGLKYQQTGTTHTEMGFIQQKEESRRRIQAAFRVPDAELSIFRDMPYANALTADRNFWSKALIPWMRYIELAFEADLFTDAVEFGMFDLSSVEALATLLQESLTAAETLQRIGYPVNMVNERMDLGMPEVPWGDDAYTNIGMVPFSELTQTLEDQFGAPPAGAADEVGEPDVPRAPGLSLRSKEARIGGRRWNGIMGKIHAPSEKRFQRIVRAWFFDAMQEQLRRVRVAGRGGSLERGAWQIREVVRQLPTHDQIRHDHRCSDMVAHKLWRCALAQKVRVSLGPEWLDFIIYNQQEFANRIARSTRPEYDNIATLAVDDAANDLGGVFAFDLADPRMLEFLADKQSDIVNVSRGVHEQVRQELLEGLSAGENMADLQTRVGRAFNFLASPVRTLRIARTETAQTLNGTRDRIFRAEGIEKAAWVTAGGENVRPAHVLFGRQAPKELGFNYLTLTGETGVLEFPSDPRGPAGEVINCRCIHLPIVK